MTSEHNWPDSGFDIQSYDEQDRITLEHYILKISLGRNYTSPVTEILTEGSAEVLDVGCGPGMWVMEMGTEFPLTHFTGIETHECFPVDVFPSNTTFQVVSPPMPLHFADGRFDFVHQRMRLSEYLKSEWKPAIAELVRVTKKGGWIELTESDMDIVKAGEATRYLAESAIKLAHSAGIHTTVSRELANLLREAGLQNVEERSVMVPSGKWGGIIGTLFKEDMQRIFTAVKSESSKETAEYESNMKRMLDEVEENKSFTIFRVAYGQKAL